MQGNDEEVVGVGRVVADGPAEAEGGELTMKQATSEATTPATARAGQRKMRERDMAPPVEGAEGTLQERRSALAGVSQPFDLTAELPAVLVSVRGAFLKWGFDFHTAEDLAQEVAVRLLQKPPPFHRRWNLERWCFRVALNLKTDELRRRQRRRTEPLAELPDTASAENVERTVQYRLAEQELLAALGCLTGVQYRALRHLLASLDGPALPDLPAERWQRFAARDRLRVRITNYPAALPIARQLRHWLRRQFELRSRWLAAATLVAVAPVAVSFVVVVEHHHGHLSQAPPNRPAARLKLHPAVAVEHAPELGWVGAARGGRELAVASATHGQAVPPTVPAERVLVVLAEPGGGDGGVSLPPNNPDKALFCVTVTDVTQCLAKPRPPDVATPG